MLFKDADADADAVYILLCIGHATIKNIHQQKKYLLPQDGIMRSDTS
jgi:hypothetical protein